MKLHVVVTTQSDGENELFCDVVHITDDEEQATLVVKGLRDYSDNVTDADEALKIIYGIDVDNLIPFENATHFERELNGGF